jgi:hypothetical protein
VTELWVWLEGTALSTWARESPSIWAYPTILTLHTVGLAIVVGASAIIDFRLLGVARRIPLRMLANVLPIIAVAFALNAATGIVLFMCNATTKGQQPVLYIKLALIGLAVWTTFLARRLICADDAGPARFRRWIATSSLLLWAGAIAAGRLMAYL